MDSNVLSLLIWVPILGGILTLVVGSGRPQTARIMALVVSLVTLALCIPLIQNFDSAVGTLQLVEQYPWIPSLNIHYALGVDGISMPLIVLTSFITVIVVIAGWEVITDRPQIYMAAFLVMTGLMNGVFAAADSILFYILWEAMLIPMFVIIGIWGGPNRIYATIKFFIYTFFGSVFMLVALIWMGTKAGSFMIADLQALPIAMQAQILIFVAFLLAFAVKVPMFPVHTWLPDAHVEAPTGGSVVLAAIMLKLGAYGFLRFSLPIVPDASQYLAEFMIVLSLIAVVYIGFVALVQKDMKKLIAYSSISHMGFVTLAFFLPYLMLDNTPASQLGIEGGMIQMISHGFISGAMFLAVGVLYDRLHSRQIGDYGGVVNVMPAFAAFAVFFAMSNAGLPGTSGFVGEFMVILASFQANFWIAVLAATTLILGAAYTLWMVKRVVFGKMIHDGVKTLNDMNGREFFIMATLALCVLALGLYPQPVVEIMHASIDNLVTQMSVTKIGGGV
jgi:NADH-quinone oxidoreductase subunit M